MSEYAINLGSFLEPPEEELPPLPAETDDAVDPAEDSPDESALPEPQVRRTPRNPWLDRF